MIGLSFTLGPPSKPSGPLTASVVNDTELILTWNPPDFDGGSPVTAYFLNVQCEEKDWDFLAEIPAGHEKFLSHRVKHLNRNTKYRFSVKAINQWGPSDYLEMEEQIQTKAITGIRNIMPIVILKIDIQKIHINCHIYIITIGQKSQ